jgi:hypothetical protein
VKKRFTYVLLVLVFPLLSVVIGQERPRVTAHPNRQSPTNTPAATNAPDAQGQPAAAPEGAPAGPDGQPSGPRVMQLPPGAVMPPNLPPHAMPPGDIAVPQPGGPEAAADAMAAAAAQAAGAGPPSTQPAGPWSALRPMPEKYHVLMTRNIFVRGGGRAAPKGPSPGGAIEAAFAFRGAGREDGSFTAFIEEVGKGGIKRFHKGDRVAGGKIGDISLSSMEYESNGRTTKVAVGYNLAGAPVPPPAPATAPAGQPGQPGQPPGPNGPGGPNGPKGPQGRPAKMPPGVVIGPDGQPMAIPAGAQMNAEGPQPPQPPQ